MVEHPTITAITGYWEGDTWIDGNYRVSRKWVDLLPGYYGPGAKDPDNGKGHIEYPNRVNEIIAKVTGVTGVLDCDSEIHALQAGTLFGYLYLSTSNDIPPVPIFWCTGPNADNDSHYFMTGLVAGRAGRKLDDAKIDWKTLAASLATAAAVGGIGLQTILKYISPVSGV